jgi:hypothetical protein
VTGAGQFLPLVILPEQNINIDYKQYVWLTYVIPAALDDAKAALAPSSCSIFVSGFNAA